MAKSLRKDLFRTSPRQCIRNVACSPGARRRCRAFSAVPDRNVVAWTGVIGGHARHGDCNKALEAFTAMRRNGLDPDVVTWTALIGSYARIGECEKALEAFMAMRREGLQPNVVTWTALIAGYARHGECEKAIEAFMVMRRNRIEPNAVTIVCALRACGGIAATEMGQRIHAQAAKRGIDPRSSSNNSNRFIANALIGMYAKCGSFGEAREVLDAMIHAADVVSWTALIAGYAQHGHGDEAMLGFREMQQKGALPNSATFVNGVKACGSIGEGRKMHAVLCTGEDLRGKTIVTNALIGMYARCGLIEESEALFEELEARDVVTWTTLIAWYVRHGHEEEGLECFGRMRAEGIRPNAITYASVLRACASIGSVEMGTDVHGLLARDGLLLPPCRDIALGNALVYLYAKTGKLASVEDLLFDALAVCRDAITWNTAILGYAHGDDGEEDARRCFVQMQCEGFYADAVALSCIVKSCGSIANGHRLHTAVVADEQPAKESVIANALVDMYTRCGSVAEAQAVFKLMLAAPDAGSWNVLIASYAQSGDHYLASRMFSKMIARGKLPDVVTFAHLLSACNHSGESEKAHAYLHAMIASYGLIPMSEHYACLIDLLARSGRLDDATELIERLPLAIGLSAWHSLQSACRRRPGDSSRWALLGRYAFDHAIQLDEASSAAYRLYEQNLFASSGSEVS